MSVLDQRAILLKSGEQQRVGVLHVLVFTPHERLVRAAKVWGLSWLLALASVPIIIAHWVLVPGFFIARTLWAYKRPGMPLVPDHANGQCPTNGEVISLALEPSDRLPLWTYCPVCHASIQLLERERA